MKLGANSVLFGGYDLETAFRHIAMAGYDGSELSVELNFNKMADFSPENVVKQVKPLNDLLEIRTQLKALLSKTEGNDRLEELLAIVRL